MIAAEWDTWRKRSIISHRKAQLRREAEGAPSSSAPTAAMEVIEAEESPFPDALPFPNENRTQSSEQDLEDDIQTVVRFFADGNDFDKTEDETLVWRRLGARVGPFW